MAKRMIVMLTVTLVVLGGLGFVKFKQIQVAIAQGASFQPPPEAVTTIVAERAEWSGVLDSIGTMAAVQGVTVSADLPGTRGAGVVRVRTGGERGRGARGAGYAAGAGTARRTRSPA